MVGRRDHRLCREEGEVTLWQARIIASEAAGQRVEFPRCLGAIPEGIVNRDGQGIDFIIA
jgi:hypothetical protein